MRDSELIERRQQVSRDLEELAAQVEDGEVDSATAGRLRSSYLEELRDLDDRIASTGYREGDYEATAEPQEPQTARRWLPLGAVVGGAAILGVMTGLIILLGTQGGGAESTPDPPPPVAAGAIDVDSMSIAELEDSLATFPESNTVRLALADRYLERGDRQLALEHYLTISAGDAEPRDQSRALARVGYLAYATGQHESALAALEESLDHWSENTEAQLYMGYVLFNGLGDAERAAEYFTQALEDPRMPVEVIEAVREILAEIKEGGAEQ